MVKMGGKIREIIRKRKWKIHVKTWMLLVAVLVLLPIDATLLRYDHIRMTELRDAVLEVDAEISNDESDEVAAELEARLVAALTELKEFVFSHIVVNVVEENGVQRVSFGTGPFILSINILERRRRLSRRRKKCKWMIQTPMAMFTHWLENIVGRRQSIMVGVGIRRSILIVW